MWLKTQKHQWSEGILLGSSLLLEEVGVFVPFQPAPDRMRPAHMVEGNLLNQNLLI